MGDKLFESAVQEFEEKEKAKSERSEKRKPGETLEAYKETKDIEQKMEIAINEALVGMADAGLDVKSGRIKLGKDMVMLKDGGGIYCTARHSDDISPDRKPTVFYKPIPKKGPWASMKKAFTGKTEYEDSVMVYVSLNDAEAAPGMKDKDAAEKDTVIALLAKYDKEGNLVIDTDGTSADVLSRDELNKELGSNSLNARSKFLRGDYSQEAYSRNLFGIVPSAEQLGRAGQNFVDFINAKDLPFDERLKRDERVQETVERIRSDAEAVTYQERADNWEKMEYARKKVLEKSKRHQEVAGDYFGIAFEFLEFGRSLDEVHSDLESMGRIQGMNKADRKDLVARFETQRKKKISDQKAAEKKRRDEELEEERQAQLALANLGPKREDFQSDDDYIEAWGTFNDDKIQGFLDLVGRKRAKYRAQSGNGNAAGPNNSGGGGYSRGGKGAGRGRNTP